MKRSPSAFELFFKTVAELPEVRIRIIKQILIEPKKTINKDIKKKTMFLESIFRELYNTDYFDKIPGWAKLSIASIEKPRHDEDYYVFGK